VDRGALPAQTNILAGQKKDAYLVEAPANEAGFLAVFAHSLGGGYSPQEAKRVASVLLPDPLS
jgi:hypothetical protein